MESQDVDRIVGLITLGAFLVGYLGIKWLEPRIKTASHPLGPFLLFRRLKFAWAGAYVLIAGVIAFLLILNGIPMSAGFALAIFLGSITLSLIARFSRFKMLADRLDQ